MRRVSILAALLFLSGPQCSAADRAATASKDLFYWANLGMGFATWRRDLAGTLSASISANQECEMATFRFIHNTDFKLIPSKIPDDYILELGVLYGRVAKSIAWFASVSAGLAILSTTSYSQGYYNQTLNTDTYNSESAIGIGIPVEAQAFWTPANFLGIGVIAYGDYGFGKARSFAGIEISLRVGMLR